MKKFPRTIKQNTAHLNPSMLLLSFKKSIKKEEVQKNLKEFKLELVTAKKEKNIHWYEVNHTNQRFWIQTTNRQPVDDKVFEALEKGFKKQIEWIGPVYNSTDNFNENQYNIFCPLPSTVLVDKKIATSSSFKKLSKELGLRHNELKSKYLNKHDYFELRNPLELNSFEVFQKTDGQIIFENMPLFKPISATIPNDVFWGNQWNMPQINAPDGWDISTGNNSVVICVLDEGCDLTHPDLQFSEPGINLGTMAPDGSPTGNHGTACAGIAAASFNNNEGVAGLAGNCLIMPLAFQSWTDVEVATGINYATINGANIISMSFGWNAWNTAIIDPAIQNAFNNDVVQCVATHNYNSSITYPATNPLVMACGASSIDDNRKSPTSPDGEGWGSNFGNITYNGVRTGVSVVAPGVLIPTTDRQGTLGYNNSGGVGGNYHQTFNGTSSATPHVAGLAALLKSQYPLLSNIEIRNIIERTAAKVGTLGFSETLDFPNGTRNEEMGYGRIDAFQALDFADIMIKDWSGDDGTEPSSPPSGNFWSFSDIVVRITDDNVFNPSNPSQSKHVERGQTNYIYVRVTNNGPNDARNVSVNIRITPYIGLQFVYPNDWTLIDNMHVNPTSIINNFPSIPSGGTVIAKFSISAAQVEYLYGWQTSNPWHPCLLAEVVSDNDYAYQSADLSFGNIVVRKNNFAQRNLSVIDVFAGASLSFPFVVGSHFQKQETIRLIVDRSGIPDSIKTRLRIDNNEQMFPAINFAQREIHDENRKIVIHEKSCIGAIVGGCSAKIDLEKGSIIYLNCNNDSQKLRLVEYTGGKPYKREDINYIELNDNSTLLEFKTAPQSIHPLSIELDFLKEQTKEKEYTLSVYQIDKRKNIIGGASVIYKIK